MKMSVVMLALVIGSLCALTAVFSFILGHPVLAAINFVLAGINLFLAFKHFGD